MVEFVQLRGEYASFAVVIVLLWLSTGAASRLFGISRREAGDLFFNATIAFVIAGRVAYLAAEAPRSLLDPLVMIRFQAGLEPLAGVAGAAAVGLWHMRGGAVAPRWAVAGAGAAGLAVATVGYDAACVLRDACYGVEAPAPLGFEMSGLSEPRMATPLIEAALVLAAAALILASAPRLSPRTPPLLLLATLALVRAALTPASALGAEAIGLETLVLAAGGVMGLGVAVLMEVRRPVPV